MTEASSAGRTVMARLLDLFSKAGGAGAGYARAGFEVWGVDIARQPRNPFIRIQSDVFALDPEWVASFDAIHASPPCQRYSQATASGAWRNHPDLIAKTRAMLVASGRPYVIENVPRAPLIDPLVLCGSMFDLVTQDADGTELHLRRHRLFESNVPLQAPQPCKHPRGVQWAGSYGGARRDKHDARHVRHGGYVPSAKVQGVLMGIDWMSESEMHEAIPPAYTEHIGRQLMRALHQQGGQ